MDRDVLDRDPLVAQRHGIQAIIPGLSSGRRSGGITGGSRRHGRLHYGGPRIGPRTLHDGINTGWAGANSNAAVSNVAGLAGGR